MKNKHLVLLKREHVSPNEDLKVLTDEEIDAIANQGNDDQIVAVVEKLGYIPPSVKQARERNHQEAVRQRKMKEAAQLPLAKTLRQAGIKPFTPESVEAYKKAKVRNRFQIFSWNLAVTPRLVPWVFIAGFLVNIFACYLYIGLAGPLIPILCLFGSAIVVGTSSHRNPSRIREFIFTFFATGAGGSLLLPIIIFGPSDREWKIVYLEDYKKDIPRPILGTIAEIHALCPPAIFMVDELQRKPDPFLVVCLGEEKYYVEVWNEPKFDGDRAA